MPGPPFFFNYLSLWNFYIFSCFQMQFLSLYFHIYQDEVFHFTKTKFSIFPKHYFSFHRNKEFAISSKRCMVLFGTFGQLARLALPIFACLSQLAWPVDPSGLVGQFGSLCLVGLIGLAHPVTTARCWLKFEPYSSLDASEMHGISLPACKGDH